MISAAFVIPEGNKTCISIYIHKIQKKIYLCKEYRNKTLTINTDRKKKKKWSREVIILLIYKQSGRKYFRKDVNDVVGQYEHSGRVTELQ